MKAQHINPFLESANSILGMFQLSPRTGSPSLRQTPFKGIEVLTVVGVTGQLRGQVYLGFSRNDALRIVSNMMGGASVAELDPMALSALSEIGNMICGNATIQLSQNGVAIDITPPTVIIGSSVEVAAVKI
ncbi:chemotaxis protein CheX, partial [Cohnella suwonensis]